MFDRLFRSRRFASGLLTTLAVAVLAGCGTSTEPQEPPPGDRVASMGLDPADVAVAAGDSRRLTATPRSATGGVVTGVTIAWSTTDADVASVDGAGTVTARRPGTATITAVAGGRLAEARVRVLPTPTEPLPAPQVAALLPAGRPAQGGQFTLTVTGTGFSALSEVQWNGRPRATQFVSATELRATILDEDVAVAGTAQVTVQTPAPGGGRSTALAFTVTARIASLEVQGTLDLWLGESTALVVAAKDAAGGIVTGLTFEFVSSAPTLAIDQRGVLTAQSVGRATITVRGGGREVQVTARAHRAPAADLVFHGTGGQAAQLFAITPAAAGQQARELATVGVRVRDLAVSPDGQRIAFAGQGTDGNVDLYVIRRDGTGLVRLTTHAAADDQPAWSPDGTRLAFRSDREGRSDVFVLPASGGQAQRVTLADFFGDPQFARPVWSRDGARILMVRTDGSTSARESEILAWVETTGALVGVVREAGVLLDEPALSPDGRFLVVRRQAQGQAAALRVFDLEVTPQLQPTDFGAGRAPAWSPDGNYLVFIAANAGRDELIVTTPGAPFRKVVTTGAGAAWLAR